MFSAPLGSECSDRASGRVGTGVQGHSWVPLMFFLAYSHTQIRVFGLLPIGGCWVAALGVGSASGARTVPASGPPSKGGLPLPGSLCSQPLSSQ